jgi:heme/copper-type cytochrome/quinol oxidase subunit 3
VVLNVPLTAANTFFLICSSVTMVKAFAEIERGNQQGLRRYLIATALIGMLFVGIQGVEYYKLAQEGFVPVAELYQAVGRQAHEAGLHDAPTVGGPLYGATFYAMTGFHGLHVSIGVLCLWFTVFQAFRGRYTPQNVGGVEIMGLYWHFVDLVWIILFTIVYLI